MVPAAGGPAAAGAGCLRLRERTRLLLLHIDTVSCCSPGAPMAAAATACGPPRPWTYRSVAGEFAYLERSFVAELAPPRLLAEPPVPPRAWGQQDPPAGRQPRPREPPSGAAPLPPQPVPGGRPGPPSYEAHMLRMAQARRAGPPPYVSPPAYDGPHRTLPRPPAPRRAPPGRWSHTLPRAATEARPRRQPPPRWGRSHTLPRAAASPRGPRGAAGGHFVIDATRVRVRAEYVPPPRREQVRYVGTGPAGRVPGPIPRPEPVRVARAAPPAAASAGLGSPEQRGGSPGRGQVPGSPRQRGGSRSPGHRGVPASPGRQGSPGFPRHLGVSRSPGPRGMPESPRPREVPGSPEHWVSPGSPEHWVSPGSPRGPVSPRRRPPYARRPALYAQDLREAVSRIRRHTAPDSDSEAEAPRSGGSCRRCRDTRAWSSSSSSSLEGAGAGAAACA